MRFWVFFLLIFGITGCAKAMDVSDIFERYLWQKRVVVVFTPDRNNDEYLKQVEILKQDKNGLRERDIEQWVVIEDTLVIGEGKILPHFGTPPFYEEFDVDRGVFAFLLLGKDGGVKIREAEAVDLDLLFATIDAMPMRKREME